MYCACIEFYNIDTCSTLSALSLVKNPCFISVQNIEKCVLLFFATLSLYHKTNEEAQAVYFTMIKHDRHLRTLKKCGKHSPAALVFDIPFVFSKACCVLSQYNTCTQLRPLYLLNRNTSESFGEQEILWEHKLQINLFTVIIKM